MSDKYINIPNPYSVLVRVKATEKLIKNNVYHCKAYTAADAIVQAELYWKNIAKHEGYLVMEYEVLFVVPFGVRMELYDD